MTTAASGIRVADLSQNTPTPFLLIPTAEELRGFAQEMGVDALRKLRFEGQISAQDKRDWKLTATLGFTVVQPCVVTLEPVTTRVETRIERIFVSVLVMPDEEEVEMPEDDNVEELGKTIDPAAVMMESVALNLPSYPRKDGAELGSLVHTEPGRAAMTDEDVRPFAGLAGLMGLKDAPDGTPSSEEG